MSTQTAVYENSIAPSIIILSIGAIMLFIAIGIFATMPDSKTTGGVIAIFSILFLVGGAVMLALYMRRRPSGNVCTNNTGCPTGEYCNSQNVCVQGVSCANHAQCPAGQVCSANAVCLPIGYCNNSSDCTGQNQVCDSNHRCTTAGACTDNTQCKGGLRCNPQTLHCASPCTNDGGCGTGQKCTNGFCSTPTTCTQNSDCGNGNVCFQGACTPGFRCNAVSDCPTGQNFNACLNNICQTVPTPINPVPTPINPVPTPINPIPSPVNPIPIPIVQPTTSSSTSTTGAVGFHPSGVVNYNSMTGAVSNGSNCPSGNCGGVFTSKFSR